MHFPVQTLRREMDSKKRKGGAEKIRDKKKKQIEDEVRENKKIEEMFAVQNIKKSRGIAGRTVDCDHESSGIRVQPGSSLESSTKVQELGGEDVSEARVSEDISTEADATETKLSEIIESAPKEEKVETIQFQRTDHIPQEEVATSGTIVSQTIKDAATDEVAETGLFKRFGDTTIIPPEKVAGASRAEESLNVEDSSSLPVEYRPRKDDPQVADFLFERPKSDQLSHFFQHHPIQPNTHKQINAQLAFWRKDGSKRSWLTYSKIQKALFCTVCLAFTECRESGPFIRGVKNWRHIYQRIIEHEASQGHRRCTDTYMMTFTGIDTSGLHQQELARSEQIGKSRAILERVIDIAKVLGKRGLSCRGKSESMFDLDNEELDHGNVLEILLLLSKFDAPLKEYIEALQPESERETGQGEGAAATLMSKTTVGYVIEAISKLIKKVICQEIGEAGLFSIQIDSTQDVSVTDQCSIIVRYVTDTVHERLLSVTRCTLTTAKGLSELLQRVVKEYGLDLHRCIGISTDGAFNMQGQYSDFTSWLSKESPGKVHVWCYAHVLNLVLAEGTQASNESTSLFGLLNSCAVFFHKYYKSMDAWHELSTEERADQIIGETSWWEKDTALRNIFGSFNNPDKAMFIDLIIALNNIGSNTDKFNSNVRYQALHCVEYLCKFQTVLTAQLYLQIFNSTTQLSNYLQTTGMDVLQAQLMVSDTMKALAAESRNFDSIYSAAEHFAEWANVGLEQRGCDEGVETELPEGNKMRMPGMSAKDEPITLAKDRFRVDVHNAVMDNVIQNLTSRFKTYSSLAADISCLDPKHFNKDLPDNALVNICSLLARIDGSITVQGLKEELLHFAANWSKLRRTLPEEYGFEGQGSEDPALQEEFGDQPKYRVQKCKTCRSCAACCYSVLNRYTLFSTAYQQLYLAYKYILTLSCTQVACKRGFSRLNNIKTHLRNHLSQDNLEAFMLMSVEQNVLVQLQNADIIDLVAQKSALLQELLIE
ncbi:zinc finger MYM-type protein 1-like isoform X2 [Ambystoma mexicanum]|uniref:zinc finger MYM-type protein 1-like isoform X2 n=1 Tax=Ambystoma mexicanum TaxID=8296 RepID=UPI0037E91550